MKKTSLLYATIIMAGLLSAKTALAVCPVCTVAVAAGIGFSRYLGIDDSITGLWIGGLTVSMIVWTLTWFQKKNIRFKGMRTIIIIGYYVLIVVPLYFMGLLGHPSNAVIGSFIDKLLIGIVVGSVSFWVGASWYLRLKEKNNGHAYFPFQKVVMPISPLIILSILFYFITK